MAYSEKELKAINEKFNHPENDVICPRCGKKLLFSEGASFAAVKCETDNCLYDAIRGI